MGTPGEVLALRLLTALLAGTGVLLMAVAVPLMLRRVPPNRWYGVRLPATLADRDLWYEANARGGRDLFLLGAAFTAAVLALPRFAPGRTGVGRVLVPMAVLSVGGMVVAARALLHAGRPGGGRPGSRPGAGAPPAGTVSPRLSGRGHR